ncbi:hypothetical protein [Streptomyces violaceusniger]|uniref:Uncharacterized protein n=1 Tax=Streptomyces violaceusniger (strain Tu 4113) TaxID=653045 RepID=G2NZW4_STRV4|nr:hypothetical protein [Streptomyces violaceusniger]AEM80200.1 hypothetical protein Strvi_0412 [Streptomyces violaceusniger Tu 4113]
MEPTFADFAVEPVRLANAAVKYRRCTFGGNHLKLDAGGAVSFAFTVAGDAVRECVRRLDPARPSAAGAPHPSSGASWGMRFR